MRIAILIDTYGGSFIGGGQVHVDYLTRTLAAKYHCQFVIFSQPKPNFLFRFAWSLWVIPQVIISNYFNNYDLIHSHGYQSGISAKIISIFLRIPVVHTAHGAYLIDQNTNSLKKILEKFCLITISYDCLITVSRSLFVNKPNSKRIIYIPNGVDSRLFFPKKNPKTKSNIFKIIFVGRLEVLKGINSLLLALNKLRYTHKKHVMLTIVGEGSKQQSLKDLATSLQLSKITRFIGKKPPNQISKLYNQHNIFVLPSIGGEGQPLTILEAWACKLPVVASSIGDLPFLIKDGHNGFLLKPNSPNSLTKNLLNAINNPNLLEKFAENGYKLIKSQHQWDKVAQKTYNVYQRVV